MKKGILWLEPEHPSFLYLILSATSDYTMVFHCVQSPTTIPPGASSWCSAYTPSAPPSSSSSGLVPTVWTRGALAHQVTVKPAHLEECQRKGETFLPTYSFSLFVNLCVRTLSGFGKQPLVLCGTTAFLAMKKNRRNDQNHGRAGVALHSHRHIRHIILCTLLPQMNGQKILFPMEITLIFLGF